MKEYRVCEAPIHHPDCNGVADSKDHFTPKVIAHILGWSRKRLNDPMNIQFLSKPCHIQKDLTTPRKAEQLRYQLRGGFIAFNEHD